MSFINLRTVDGGNNSVQYELQSSDAITVGMHENVDKGHTTI